MGVLCCAAVLHPAAAHLVDQTAASLWRALGAFLRRLCHHHEADRNSFAIVRADLACLPALASPASCLGSRIGARPHKLPRPRGGEGDSGVASRKW